MLELLKRMSNEIQDTCETIGRKGSIVTPVFPIGWENGTLYENNKRSLNENEMHRGKYKGFKGILISEVRNCGTLFIQVEIMEERIWFLASQLEFVTIKSNHERIKKEIKERYKLELEANYSNMHYQTHKYSWDQQEV